MKTFSSSQIGFSHILKDYNLFISINFIFLINFILYFNIFFYIIYILMNQKFFSSN
jgi:hypothetical protein